MGLSMLVIILVVDFFSNYFSPFWFKLWVQLLVGYVDACFGAGYMNAVSH